MHRACARTSSPRSFFAARAQPAAHMKPALRTGLMAPAWCLLHVTRRVIPEQANKKQGVAQPTGARLFHWRAIACSRIEIFLLNLTVFCFLLWLHWPRTHNSKRERPRQVGECVLPRRRQVETCGIKEGRNGESNKGRLSHVWFAGRWPTCERLDLREVAWWPSAGRSGSEREAKPCFSSGRSSSGCLNSNPVQPRLALVDWADRPGYVHSESMALLSDSMRLAPP